MFVSGQLQLINNGISSRHPMFVSGQLARRMPRYHSYMMPIFIPGAPSCNKQIMIGLSSERIEPFFVFFCGRY